MASLFESLLGQLGGDNLAKLSQTLGADKETTGKAVGTALPLLLGALQRNSSNPQGAEALASALGNHEGGILDNVGDFLKRGDTADGNGILAHLLGGKRGGVEKHLSKASGLDAGAIAKLLPMLAPIVMGQLGKMKKQGGLGVSELAGMLSKEEEEIERHAPKAKSFIGGLLDQDGDGDFDLSDVTKGLLGKLF